MIRVEYKLVKWKEGSYRELPVIIQQEAVEDFCEMMGWDEQDFANNTIRRPIYSGEEDPINSVQKIELVEIINPKAIKKIKKVLKKKRNRRTKVEMAEEKVVVEQDQVEEKGGRKKRVISIFSEEMNDIIKENWEDKRDKDLVVMIAEEMGHTFTIDQVKVHRRKLGLVKERGGQLIREKTKKKMGPKKKWTDKIIQYLRDNINNFSSKELCEEIESKFNLQTNVANLQGILSQKGIKRDHKISDINPKILEFINESKTKEVYVLREEIIEKFEVDVNIAKLRNLISQRKEKLSGEDVDDEVKRIEKQREEEQKEEPEFFEDDEVVDDLDLDN